VTTGSSCGGHSWTRRRASDQSVHPHVSYARDALHGEAAFASPGRSPVRRIFLLEHGPGIASSHFPERCRRQYWRAVSLPFISHRLVDRVLALLEEMVELLPLLSAFN